MGETGGVFTENSGPETVSEVWAAADTISRRVDHLDETLHALMQSAGRIEAHLTAMQADLDAARPLLEKWQKSGLARLARGQMPWGQA